MTAGAEAVGLAQSVPAAVSRTATVSLGALGALIVGGVAQAVVWRWDIDWLTAVTNSQFLWVLLCFLVAWGWSRGQVLPGIAAGAATGLALIASYYGMQWLVDGRSSAVGQFTDSRGVAWTAASVVGGAGVGLFGALAACPAVTRPRRKAFGLVSAALILAGGPATWLATRSQLAPEGAAIAAATYGCVAAALLWVALRRCGAREAIRGGALAAIVAALVLATLFVLQNSLLYLTY